jgi:hypothetical protein
MRNTKKPVSITILLLYKYHNSIAYNVNIIYDFNFLNVQVAK